MDEQPAVKKRKVGRPQDEEKREAFFKVTKFLEENDDEQKKEYLSDTNSEAYGRQHMKTHFLSILEIRSR